MNYSHFIIRVCTEPKSSFCDNEIMYCEFIGKFHQFRNHKYTLCKVSSWGTLAYDISRYYDRGDYLMVEGYLCSKKSNLDESDIQTSVEISAYRVYPYALKKVDKRIKK